MSRVMLLAADRPLPLCNYRELRTKTFSQGSVTAESGFAVENCTYYQSAVEDLGYDWKPCLYELSLERDPHDLEALRSYLEEHLTPGEAVELWSVWVGDVGPVAGRPRRYRGKLTELDMDALGMLFEEGQICLTAER
ncbi:MAG: hypothetical protein HFF18_06485 [Oscillospiraceae bacterium]|nr:hypothetical protein [Oscillospiraceae bacterium]